ncbi:MAG: extracellular solute-binding protein [Chloroflexi bacterium]|nr:extracellular solute-binding protein [Chloroflexota bacterium]
MKTHKILIVAMLFILAIAVPAHMQDGLTIWITGGENDATTLAAAAEAFTAETGIAVTVEAVGWGDAYSRYLTAINSGSGADMYAGGMSWGISLGGVGGLVDLSSAAFADEVPALLEGNNPEFVKGIIGVDGAIYGVPYNQDVMVMYYLKDNLAQAGFDAPPATWEELAAALEALDAAGLGSGGFGWGHASWLSFQPFLAQAGGAWYADDCSASAVNSEAGLTALEFYTELYDTYGFPQEQASTAGFSTGEVSILFEGEWAALGIDPSYPDLAGKWGIAPMPVGPAGNNASFVGGKGIGIFSYSTKVDEAWQFIKWLQTPEAAAAIAANNFNLSSLWLPPQTVNSVAIAGGEELAGPIAAQLGSTTPPPNCPGWEESNADVNLILQSVLFEGAAFEDALAELQEVLDAALETYGG